MRDFNSGDRSRGKRDSSRRDFGGRDSRRPSLFDAVCDECGKDCKVPFRPTGDKPIYCSDCFEKRGGRDNDRSRSRRDFGGRDSRRPAQGGMSDRSISQFVEKVDTLNKKLDKIIDLLSSVGEKQSKPVKEKPVKSKMKKDKTTKKTSKKDK